MRRLLAISTACAVMLVGLPGVAGAEPGDLDGTYGECGFSLTSPTVTSTNTSATDELIRQSSGKTLHVVLDGSSRVTVVRLRVDGSVDPTYGTAGTLVADLRAGLILPPVRRAYAGTNDRLYLIGSSTNGALTLEARRADGTLDTSFDGDGRRQLPGNQLGSAVVQPDGRIVVATWEHELVLHRFELDGSDDPTFVMSAPEIFATTAPIFMTSDPWHRISIVTGSASWMDGIHRFGPDGALDSSFTFESVVPRGRLMEYFPTDVVARDDGTVYLAARRNSYEETPTDSFPTNEAFVARYTTDGTLDPTFGNGGWIQIPGGNVTAPADLAVLADGSIIVTGRTANWAKPQRRMFVARRTKDGSLPIGWTDSVVLLADSNLEWAYVQGLVVGPDDSIDVGVSTNGASGVASVARFRLDPLKQGAGLILQWNGDAWPTRFGSDPGPECPYDTPYWENWDIARGITTVTGRGGYVLDGFGGLHRFSIGLQRPKPAAAKAGPYWNGWDIARGVAAKADGTGGYVLDGWGGLHPFSTGTAPKAAPAINGPYWPGWNITRGVALMPNGRAGYVLDGFGGIHPFTTAGTPLPPRPNHTAYWLGWDIARGISILPDGTGGYVVDAWGGVHPFGLGANPPPPSPGANAPYAPGVDWARGFAFIAPVPPATTGATATAPRTTATGSTDGRRTTARRRHPTPGGPASP